MNTEPEPIERPVPLPIRLLRPGLLPYPEACALQRELVADRSAGRSLDTLILLEHPHTYTLGRKARREHLLVDEATLAAQGVALCESDRGGDITYHGPGQIVGYPILKLAQHGADVGRYLRLLEALIIGVLASYGLVGQRERGLTGVWVGQEKVAAIGVKLSSSGISSHGFALNVAPDLRFFEQIIPCGIRDRGVTSMQKLLGVAPPLHEVEARLMHEFARLFGAALGDDFDARVLTRPAHAPQERLLAPQAEPARVPFAQQTSLFP
jgi:lipoyl(octanoyl) transferase